MTGVLSVASLLVGVALLWAGVKRVDFGSPAHAAFSTIELLALVVSIIALGWLGFGLVVASNLLGALAWGMVNSVRIDEEMTYAAIQLDREPAELKALYKWLNRQSAVRAMGARRRSRLIHLLSDRSREPAEIRPMAIAIARLWTVYRPPLDWLVGAFDQVMRLYDRSATEAEAVADELVAATIASAATFDEMLDAAIVAGGGDAPPSPRAMVVSGSSRGS